MGPPVGWGWAADVAIRNAPEFPIRAGKTARRNAAPRPRRSVGLGYLDPVQALRQGARVAALGQLDPQPHLVGRVGVAQRVLVGDLAGLVELEQALVEGLHTQVGG